MHLPWSPKPQFVHSPRNGSSQRSVRKTTCANPAEGSARSFAEVTVPDGMDDFAEMDLSCHPELVGFRRCPPELVEAGFPSWSSCSVDTKFDMHLGAAARSPEWDHTRCQELNRALKLNNGLAKKSGMNMSKDCAKCIPELAASEPTDLSANRRQTAELLTLSSQVRECTQLLSDADEERTMLQAQARDMNRRLAELEEEAKSRTDELIVLHTELTTLQQRNAALEQGSGQTLDDYTKDDYTKTDDAAVGASGDAAETDDVPVTAPPAAHRYQAKKTDIKIVHNETEQARHSKMKDQVRQELLLRVKATGQWSCLEGSRQWASRSA